MSYVYTIDLYLAAANPTLQLIDKKAVLKEAETRYNAKSVHMQNSKSLEIISIDPILNCVHMTLTSELSLNSVGRAFRTFSTILINDLGDADFKEQVTGSGALFKTVIPDKEKPSKEPGSSTAEISDLDFVKGLMDYLVNKRDPDSTAYRKKRMAMEEMKKIARESGLIER